jgi:hypothetical protein
MICTLVFICFTKLIAANDWTFAVNVAVKNIESRDAIDGATILITNKKTNARVYSALSSANQKIKLNLEANEDYNLKISKDGFVSKTISISTRNVKVDDKSVPSYIFDVIAELLSSNGSEDYSAFRQAFGMILYDEQHHDFLWIVNPDSKQKEDDLLAKRKKDNKEKDSSNGKDRKKLAADDSIDLDKLNKKKEDALSRAASYLQKSEDEKAFKEQMKQEALLSFNADYDAPRMMIAKSIVYENAESINCKIAITTVDFEDGRKVVFRKIVYEWGGVYYKQDNYDLTDVTYNHLQKIIVLKN